MNQTYMGCNVAKIFSCFFMTSLMVALTACGGGGGSAGTTSAGGASNSPTLTLSLLDANGVVIKTLSGGDVGTISAKFVTGLGVPIEGALVTYTSSATLINFDPVSGTSITGADGVAVIKIKPSDISAAGGITISAQAVKALLTASSTFNMSVGAASLTVGVLSLTPTPIGSLQAFSTVTVNIPVTLNGKPATSISGLGLTSVCVSDGTATLVPGPASAANGIYSATYTNKGCIRGTDMIAVSVGNSSQSISLTVDSANIGSMLFVGTDTGGSSIVLKGTGGVGRKESAVITFKVVDQTNVGLAGVTVNFAGTTSTGGLTVLPAFATSDSAGNVSTTVSSGTIPTPVKISATATRNGKTVSGLSDYLTISTGLPIQKSMSLSVDKLNIEGWNYDNEIANVTILMADQYGNPVSDGATINFVTEGGAIGSSVKGACSTVNGACSVPFRSQAFRPTNGRVTVLAYAQGIEDFVDSNGDGQYSCVNPVDANGTVVSQSAYRPLVDTCLSGGEPFTDIGDAFLDAGILAATSGVSSLGTLDGLYTPANGDLPFPYNHLTYSASGDGKWGINYIRQQVEIILSGSRATLVRQVCSGGSCRDWVPGTDGDPSIIQGVANTAVAPAAPVCSSQELIFRLVDVNNNPLPVDTKISAGDVNKLSFGTFYPDTVLSTNQVGGTQHSVIIKAEASCAKGSVVINVKTPKGNGTAFFFNSN
ncbi:MAG: Ig-like domain-containing protein [Cytophaga sp.]|nr:Ig-like domain-containing protein [Undibacterium sp.]